ncbi:MAG: DUF4340 domain-containing protein [Phototrophicaceae bacterium]
MRFNSRNLIGLVIGLVILGVLIFFNRQQANAPDPSPTPDNATTGAFFAELDQNTIDGLEIRRMFDPLLPTPDAAVTPDATPAVELPPLPFVVMSKNAENIWTIDEASAPTERAADQMIIVGTMGNLATLSYQDRFGLTDAGGTLADYGLDPAEFKITLRAGESTYQLNVGRKNPGGQRYFVQLAGDEDSIYLAPASILDNVIRYASAPPYVAAPTSTPTMFPTANPYSEVQQTATAQVQFEQALTAQAQTATAQVTPAPTSEPAAGPSLPTATVALTEAETEEATEEAAVETEEATEEVTEEATDAATVAPTATRARPSATPRP